MFKVRNENTRFNTLSANPTKWSNTLKQFVDNFPTNCLSVLDHVVGLTLKGLIFSILRHRKMTLENLYPTFLSAEKLYVVARINGVIAI